LITAAITQLQVIDIKIIRQLTGFVHQCFDHLFAVLADGGLGPEHVVKVNVYLRDMDDFPAMNAAYQTRFEAPYPARTTIGVAGLPLDARVEIELVARR